MRMTLALGRAIVALSVVAMGVTSVAAQAPSGEAVVVEVAATACNCPKYITPRYTTEQVGAVIESATADLRARVAELEARLADTD